MNHCRFRNHNRIIVLATALCLGLLGPLWATPDPDIFDGSKYEKETQKRFSLNEVIKNIGLGLPSLSGGSGPSKQGGPQGGRGNGLGQQGQGPSGQNLSIGQQRGRHQGRGAGLTSGSDAEKIGPNAGGNALGGDLAEVDLEALQEGAGSEPGGEAQSDGEKVPGGEQETANNQRGKRGSGGARGARNITLGAKDQMIPTAEGKSADSDEIDDTDGNADRGEQSDQMMRRDGPEMRGKNKGTSVGVESGQSIPTDL